MTDAPTIAPALTAEEWAGDVFAGLAGSPGGTHRRLGALRVTVWDDGSGRVYLPDDDAEIDLRPADRRALAAVLLYGQPGCFTHEDLALLRDPYAVMDYGNAITDEGRAHYARLAAIVASLLPPQET